MRKNATNGFCSKKFNDLRKNLYFKRKIEGRFFEKMSACCINATGVLKFTPISPKKAEKMTKTPKDAKTK
jgi:hypothetical protein